MKKAAIRLFILLFLFSILRTQVFCESRIVHNDNLWPDIAKNKTESIQKLITKLEQGETPDFLAPNAPVLWFHPDERYKATDPIELLSHSEIFYREVNKIFPFWTTEIVDLGPFKTPDFKDLKHNGFSPTDEVTRLLENGGIKNGLAGFELKFDPDVTMHNPAPLLWRIGFHPMFQNIQSSNGNEVLIPIEIWYHYNYNPTRTPVANHDGDWESSLLLFKVSDENGELKPKLYMVSASAHGGGSWHCADQLHKNNNHIELFSALGTHATYAENETHWRVVYPDRTGKGEAWETWKLIRPVTKEAFYGYSGSWGSSSYVHFQTAPIPPGPHFKYLPSETNVEKALADFNSVAAACH